MITSKIMKKITVAALLALAMTLAGAAAPPANTPPVKAVKTRPAALHRAKPKKSVAVTRAANAKKIIAAKPAFYIHTTFAPGSYYAADSVIVVARAPRDQLPEKLRVGIDRLSIDHAALTQMEFPHSPYVDVSYAHIPAALINGVCDVAVWHHSAFGLSLNHQELTT